MHVKYLLERAQANNGRIQLEDVESVYKNYVFDGFGEVKKNPVHTIIEEARPKVRNEE